MLKLEQVSLFQIGTIRFTLDTSLLNKDVYLELENLETYLYVLNKSTDFHISLEAELLTLLLNFLRNLRVNGFQLIELLQESRENYKKLLDKVGVKQEEQSFQ